MTHEGLIYPAFSIPLLFALIVLYRSFRCGVVVLDQKEEITSEWCRVQGTEDGRDRRVDGTHTGDVPTMELGQRSEARDGGMRDALLW